MSPVGVILTGLGVAFVIAFMIVARIARNTWDPGPCWFFGLPFFTLLLAAPVAITTNIMSEKTCHVATVVDIGGCDRSGTCSALTSLNTVEYTRYPVRGEKIHTLCETRWK